MNLEGGVSRVWPVHGVAFCVQGPRVFQSVPSDDDDYEDDEEQFSQMSSGAWLVFCPSLSFLGVMCCALLPRPLPPTHRQRASRPPSRR